MQVILTDRHFPERAPKGDLHFDQTPEVDPTEPDQVPDFDFDQSLPEAFDV